MEAAIMRSKNFLFGSAAAGMAIAIVLILNIQGFSLFSSGDPDLMTFNIEVATETSLKQDIGSTETLRQVRVIYPSPYQGVSQR
jgi:hypothetical protein